MYTHKCTFIHTYIYTCKYIYKIHIYIYTQVGWLLEFYILATFKSISGRLPICNSANSWQLYSAVPLGDQAASTMTQSHCPNIEPTSVCSIPIMQGA